MVPHRKLGHATATARVKPQPAGRRHLQPALARLPEIIGVSVRQSRQRQLRGPRGKVRPKTLPALSRVRGSPVVSIAEAPHRSDFTSREVRAQGSNAGRAYRRQCGGWVFSPRRGRRDQQKQQGLGSPYPPCCRLPSWHHRELHRRMRPLDTLRAVLQEHLFLADLFKLHW